MSRRPRNVAALAVLGLLALAAATLATIYQPRAAVISARTPTPVFHPPAIGKTDVAKPVAGPTAISKPRRPAVVEAKSKALMSRLGALPDRHHLLLRGASRKGAVPRNYLVLYKLAAKRYKLGSDGWAWLAAVGYIESLHGRTMAPGVRNHTGTWWLEVNHAYGRAYCCAGPMQFNIYSSSSRYGDKIRQAEKRSTWMTYGVDANGDGRRDPHDARDAIFSAARKLGNDGRAGGGVNWQRALLRYNNSMAYVRSVSRARDRYLRAAKRQSRAVSANQQAFLKGRAAVTSADTKIPKADRDL